jgi:hypothetical protein
MSVLGASLLGLGCNIAGISKQEDLGRGIGGARWETSGRRCAAPNSSKCLFSKGQVTSVEGGAYVVQEVSGIEPRGA